MVLGEDLLELGRAIREHCRLVVSDREVEANLRVPRVDLQRLLVLIYRFGVSTETGERRPEIRAHLHDIWIKREESLVLLYRAFDVSGLIERYRVRQLP